MKKKKDNLDRITTGLGCLIYAIPISLICLYFWLCSPELEDRPEKQRTHTREELNEDLGQDKRDWEQGY